TLAYDDGDHPLLPTSTTDGRGTTTAMSYDANGRLTSRTEAMGETEERTITWTYDATYPGLVATMEVPSVAGGGAFRTTEWLRDASGNPTTRRITGMEAGSAFSYDTDSTFNAAGQPLTADPPGHSTDDETSWSYTPPGMGDPDRGGLYPFSRTDPVLGQIGGSTDFAYDPFNRRTSVTDPNGVETTTTYDPLDRVTEIRQVGASPPADDLVTGHEYTTFGDLLRTTLPEGNVIEHGYDAAGRLTSVERKPDASTPGERTLYTLDAAGNRTREELQRWDSGASVWVTVSETQYEYSSRCQVDRVVQVIDPGGGSPEEAVTEYAYDCNGNLVEQWDANHDAETDPPTTSYTYDPLDRLTSVSQTWGGTGGGQAVTEYEYDVQDHLIQVTDAEGNVTTSTYSDRDLLTEEVSPVSGTTSHGYDEHGELTETTDARGITVTRTIDALDRVTFVDYPDDSLDITSTYDTQPTACGGTSVPVGRLGSIERDGQSVDYCYDRFGRVTRDGELTYAYDANGNRTTIGYPGGVSATYGYDFADRQTSLSVTSPGGTEPVVSAAGYLPSGPLSGLALGSGVNEPRTFDGRYAPTATTLGAPVEKTFTYTTDPVGNILEIVEQPLCTPGPVVLENQTVTTEETYVSCGDIQSGNGFAVESPGSVTFSADGTITLTDGFSVGSGAHFEAGSGALPEISHRSYTYQDVQYFLTGASGPWPEALSWTYDQIGNRLTETRDAGTPETDTYTYLTNSTTGNTPILDQVTLAVGGTRDYTWGAAGHLEEVAAGANVIDFAAAAAGRLSSADRTAAGETAGFTYDGRSLLRRSDQTAGGTASVEPVYDSAGRVHAPRRKASSTADEELVLFVYLAGRPVAQLEIDTTGTETWTYLTTDHLGTPLVATDETGAVTWEGGFQPFGRDWQEGTPDGALDAGVYLRLPGQWDDTTWQDATSGAGVYYNVHRWYQPSVGAYARPEPIVELLVARGLPPLGGGRLDEYAYARQQPLMLIDPLGLQATIRPGPSDPCSF
ncbi:MAG: RHS domain-containing protein, partial [Gemmatimonadota bacterium]